MQQDSDKPSSPRAEPVPSQPMQSDVRELGDRVRRAELWMIWLTLSIAVFALCGVVVAALQWNVMSGQLKLTRQQLKGTDAAIVRFVIGSVTGGFGSSDGVRIGITNEGHWIATDFQASLEIKRESMPDHKTLGATYPCDIHIPQVPPGDFPGSDQVCNLPEISPQDWETLHRTTETQTLKAVGRYSYGDGFGDKIEKSFCYYLFARPPHQLKNGTHAGSTPSFIECDRYDAAVKSYLRNKK